MAKQRKPLTEEQKQKMRENLAKARAARGQNKVTAENKVEPEKKPSVVLDLTEKQIDVESQLAQFILWEFDQGRNPTEIRVTSHQAQTIAEYTKQKPLRWYQSAFGSHYFKVVSAKELADGQATE